MRKSGPERAALQDIFQSELFCFRQKTELDHEIGISSNIDSADLVEPEVLKRFTESRLDGVDILVVKGDMQIKGVTQKSFLRMEC